jgi:subtilisin family serine protease
VRSAGRWVGAALAVGLVLGAGPVARAEGNGPAISAGPFVSVGSGSVAGGDRPVTVTLLTGDRVTVAGAKRYTVVPGPGRSGMRFFTRSTDGELTVLPADAVSLVAGGRLDERLFNVSLLAREGYHDAARADLPLIVTYAGGNARRAGNPVVAAGARTVRELPVVDGAAVVADKGRLGELWSAVAGAGGSARSSAAGVDRVWLDGKRRLSLEHSVSQVGAQVAHAAGLTGRGVRVAVLDTGIDASHPDLVGKVAAARNFTEDPDPSDVIGHGTHVAATIAGSGAASGGRYRGVAPDATLLDGKVCESTSCTDSAILAGMEWAAVEAQADVINMSLGGPDGPEIDPLEEAVNTLTAQTGALFVIAAGNSGEARTVNSPGSADAALTVGAVDRDDALADFSSRGPRIGDDAIKPEITAPGVGIVAARAAGTEMGEPVGDHYVAASGTSMATPHVAGAAALLAQRYPDRDAGWLKSALIGSAAPQPGQTAYEQGAGRVDVARAIGQAVRTEPVAVSFGRTRWPHEDDEPVTRTVTYRNDGSEAVELTLAVEVTGPGGAAAPAGMFALGASSVTVPAGGQAQVQVTVDTSVASADGYWTGRLVAAAGDTRVVTPLAVHKEVESYDLTVTHLGRDGAATDNYLTFLTGLDSGDDERVYGAATQTVRLPKGRYGVTSWIFGAGEKEETTVLARPELLLDGDLSLRLDGTAGRPVRMTVPERKAEVLTIDQEHFYRTSLGLQGFGVWAGDFDELWLAHLGPTVDPEDFSAKLSAQWGRRDDAGMAADTPNIYVVSEVSPGRLPNGFIRDYRARDLATIRHDYHGTGPAGRVFIDVHDLPFYSSTVYYPVALPGKRTVYASTGGGVRWQQFLYQEDPETWEGTELASSPTAYKAGRTYREVWNAAPFGPSFPSMDHRMWAGRLGDYIGVAVPLFGDSAGHAGFSSVDSGRTALYRDGALVGEFDEAGFGEFQVPAGPADYRLEVSAERGLTELATRVDAAWTFRSGSVSGDEPVALPVAAVRFTPKMRPDGTAGPGRFELPVTVEYQAGVVAPKVRQLTVEVSYDDGRTWTRAAVRSTKQGWTATVTHPRGGGFVSLRASATDADGNSVTQTVIRSYRLR